MSSESIRDRQNSINKRIEDTSVKLENGLSETRRVRNVAANTGFILEDLDEKFCKRSGLTKFDISFLFLAIGLQIARQHLLTRFPQRFDDQFAAKSTFGHSDEHSDRIHRYYNPSLEEIITNPVPFDANIGANGALGGGGRLGHRATAIGHDPILGLIFGTANIATSTLTTNNFNSYHIYTNDFGRDFFKNHAKTDLVIGHTTNKLLNCGYKGKEIIGISLVKEIIHLKSDLNTKHSLPLPFVSAINPKVASGLAEYGLDMANVFTVGKQVTYAILINTIIAMIHGLFNDGTSSIDRKLYEVRTRKILSYSNLVASSYNIAAVAITEDVSFFDLGGLAVTIYRLITDMKFISEVKQEFIFGNYKDMINGEFT